MGFPSRVVLQDPGGLRQHQGPCGDICCGLSSIYLGSYWDILFLIESLVVGLCQQSFFVPSCVPLSLVPSMQFAGTRGHSAAHTPHWAMRDPGYLPQACLGHTQHLLLPWCLPRALPGEGIRLLSTLRFCESVWWLPHHLPPWACSG